MAVHKTFTSFTYIHEDHEMRRDKNSTSFGKGVLWPKIMEGHSARFTLRQFFSSFHIIQSIKYTLLISWATSYGIPPLKHCRSGD